MNIRFKSQRGWFILICLCVAGYSCDAQTVVGKWKRNFSHMFSVSKTTGEIVYVSADVQKQYDEANKENGYQELLEMKSDNTYTSTVTAGGKQTVHSGVYSLSGKTLDMNIPLVQGEKSTITILKVNSTTMLWNLVFKGRSTGVDYEKM